MEDMAWPGGRWVYLYPGRRGLESSEAAAAGWVGVAGVAVWCGCPIFLPALSLRGRAGPSRFGRACAGEVATSLRPACVYFVDLKKNTKISAIPFPNKN